MPDKLFHCTVVTPERVALECEASAVVLPAHDGELGILHGRAPLICRLGIGRFKATTPQGERVLFVDRGVAEMVADELTVLTRVAKEPQDLDTAEYDRALEETAQGPILSETDREERADARQRSVAAHRMTGVAGS